MLVLGTHLQQPCSSALTRRYKLWLVKTRWMQNRFKKIFVRLGIKALDYMLVIIRIINSVYFIIIDKRIQSSKTKLSKY